MVQKQYQFKLSIIIDKERSLLFKLNRTLNVYNNNKTYLFVTFFLIDRREKQILNITILQYIILI
jgi:hypothetical protein